MKLLEKYIQGHTVGVYEEISGMEFQIRKIQKEDQTRQCSET
jgi:hypothetical protein